jgi:hypothetical protein
LTAFDRAWDVVKDEVPIEPFNMDRTGQWGPINIRSSKSVHQVRDVKLKDGTIVPVAYQALHEIDGTVEYFSPEAMNRVKDGRDLWDGDLTMLVSHHRCDGCGEQLDSKSEEEFEEGFVDEKCRDCRGLTVECPDCGENRPGLDIPCPECGEGGREDEHRF